jgi:hypothetical protein
MSGTPCRFFRSLTADAYQADVLSAVFPLFSSELAHVVGFRPPLRPHAARTLASTCRALGGMKDGRCNVEALKRNADVDDSVVGECTKEP